MTIIDMGNGYGMVRLAGSKCANYHFEINSLNIRKLYITGYITRDEYQHWMGALGYSSAAIKQMLARDDYSWTERASMIIERLKLHG